MSTRRQTIDFYGDTAHGSDAVRNYFTSAAFFQRLVSEKKKHLALEYPHTMQGLAHSLWQRQITPEQYKKEFTAYFERRNAADRTLSEDDRAYGRQVNEANANQSAAIIAMARTHGIRVHFVDHANGGFDPSRPTDPIYRFYTQHRIKPASDEESHNLLGRERVAQDPAVARRIMSAFGGQDGAIIYGHGHAVHKNGIPQTLRANNITTRITPVFSSTRPEEIDWYARRHYEHPLERAAGLAFHHGATDRAIDASTGREVPMPQRILDAAESTRELEGRWDYRSLTPPTRPAPSIRP